MKFRKNRKTNFMNFFLNKLHQFHMILRCMIHNYEIEFLLIVLHYEGQMNKSLENIFAMKSNVDDSIKHSQ